LEKSNQLTTAPTGGLLFTCNGRGRRMFGQPNHDIALINKTFNSCQVAGFFAQGEIGPLGQETHVHGLTSSLILFQEAQQPRP
ncbi:MAG: FIST C-terminal domain-containing protein, partial [Planctomycetes bacterium]|nr:FIST C-terminal domain-containing protein [Planctomycetota bacterium]